MKGTGSREPPLAVYSRDSSEPPNVWCALASTQVLSFRFFRGRGVYFLKEGFAVYIQPEIWSLPRGASRRIVGGWKWISMAPLTWIAVHERMKILFPRNIFLWSKGKARKVVDERHFKAPWGPVTLSTSFSDNALGMQLSKLQNVQHDPHQQNDFNNYPVIKRLITKWLGGGRRRNWCFTPNQQWRY